MDCMASKQRKWQSATIFTAVLVGIATLSAASASGCNPDAVLIRECRDAGNSDGGEGGGGGGGGDNLPICNK
jgi:hypothetical protein